MIGPQRTAAARPVAPAFRASSRRRRDADAPFTDPSDLRLTVLRMISLNSLAAFTAEVTRNAGLQPGAGVAATREARERAAVEPVAAVQQRPLEAVPAAPPGKPLPRGSLLDLRV